MCHHAQQEHSVSSPPIGGKGKGLNEVHSINVCFTSDHYFTNEDTVGTFGPKCEMTGKVSSTEQGALTETDRSNDCEGSRAAAGPSHRRVPVTPQTSIS